jgi:hypothetical protein
MKTRLALTLTAAVVALAAQAAAQTCVPETQAPPGTGSEVGGHAPGIYVASSNLPLNLPPEGDPRRDTVLACTWDDARVLGGNVIVPWSKFDRGPDAGADRFDFGWAEDEIALWSARGKKANLLVWGAAQQEKQQFDGESMTPAWLLAEGVPTVSCDPDGEGGDPALPTIPVHNDPVVRARFQEALAAFYERYKDDPRVNYVRFGAGVGSENYPLNKTIQANGACRAAWEAKGGDADAWRAHVGEMIRFFGTLQNEGGSLAVTRDAEDTRTASARDNAPIVVSLNDYKGGTQTPDIPRFAFDEAKVRWLGIGTQGPTDLHRRNWEEGRKGACTANWCNIFEDAKDDPRVPILEIQTPNATGPLGLEGVDGTGPGYTPTGSLQTLAPFLLERGTTSFELYPAEFRVANDETGNPFHEEFGDVYDDTLDAIATGALVNSGPSVAPDPEGPSFGFRPIDEVVREAGRAILPFAGTDPGKGGTGLRLTSFGKVYEGDAPVAAVFRVRNCGDAGASVAVKPLSGDAIALDVPGRTDAFVASPSVSGAATHKLLLGGRQVDVKAASPSEYDDDRPVLTAEPVPAGGGGVTDVSVGEDGTVTLTGTGQGLDRPVSAAGYLRSEAGPGAAILIATVSLVEAPAGASAGLMFRAGGAGTGGGSKFAALTLSPAGEAVLLFRDEANAAPVTVGGLSVGNAEGVRLKLTRDGGTFRAFATTPDGEETLVGEASGAFPGGPVNAGLFVASGTATDEATATFAGTVLSEE